MLSGKANVSVDPFSQMTSRTKLKRKEVDDVLGGEDHWKHADSTNGRAVHRCTFLGTTSDLLSFSDVP